MNKKVDYKATSRFLEEQEKLEETLLENKKKLCREKLHNFFDECIEADEKGKYDNIIGRRIQCIIEDKGLKIKEICEITKINRSTLHRIIKGSIPKFETLENIFIVLDFDIDIFVKYVDDTTYWVSVYKNYSENLNWFPEEVHYRNYTDDIDIVKKEIFYLLDEYRYTYKSGDKKIEIPNEYMDLLRHQIFNSFKSLDMLLNRR